MKLTEFITDLFKPLAYFCVWFISMGLILISIWDIEQGIQLLYKISYIILIGLLVYGIILYAYFLYDIKK